MWNRTVTVGRVVMAILATVAVVISVLQSEGIVPANKTLANIVTYGSLVIIALDNVVTLIRRSARDRRLKKEQDIAAAAMALLLDVCKKPELRFEKLGVCVYVAENKWKWSWTNPLSFFRETELVRVHRFRPSGYPQQSGVTWRSGKGVVGQAWQDQRTTYRNWQSIAARWADADISEPAFERIPKGTRSGFTRSDFVSIAGKYAEIVAEPIWDKRVNNKCIGVVALDRQYEADVTFSGNPLNHADTRSFLSTTAALLGTVLSTATNSVT
jgi:hypothetical protein